MIVLSIKESVVLLKMSFVVLCFCSQFVLFYEFLDNVQVSAGAEWGVGQISFLWNRSLQLRSLVFESK